MDEQQIRAIIRDEMAKGKFLISRPAQILDGNDIVIGQTLGTRLGTAASQKLAFYGKTPIIQQSGVSTPTAPSVGYVQAEAASAKTAIDALIAIVKNIGITI